MTIEKMVEKYEIKLHGMDKLTFGNIQKARKDRDHMNELIKSNEKEIIMRLKRIRAEAAKKRRKHQVLQYEFNCLPGVKELRRVKIAWSEYNEKKAKCDKVGAVIQAPDRKYEDVAREYPKAALCREAFQWAKSKDEGRSELGYLALDKVMHKNGGSGAINEMKAKWASKDSDDSSLGDFVNFKEDLTF